MGRRNNSIISIVGDVVAISSKLPWWAALLTGLIAYLLISFGLAGYIESHIAAQEESKFYPILEARFGRLVRICEWVGIACGLAGMFFAIRNYYFQFKVSRTEKGLVTFMSKIFGRNID